MRKSIFDIVKENSTITSVMDRIVFLVNNRKMLYDDCDKAYTLFEFVNLHCFEKWKQRKHFYDLSDFLIALDYASVCQIPMDMQEKCFIALELYCNLFYLAEREISSNPYVYNTFDSFDFVKRAINDILDELNHYAYINKDEEQVLVVQKDAAVTAVAEIIKLELTMPLIRYHHHALKGDIESKKAILFALGADLEEKRKTLAQLNKGLSEMIFQMLNKLNIRHNNISPSGKYEPCVASMSDEELEEWYDELYQMILHAYLLMDHQPRIKKFDELSKKMEEAKKNG